MKSRHDEIGEVRAALKRARRAHNVWERVFDAEGITKREEVLFKASNALWDTYDDLRDYYEL